MPSISPRQRPMSSSSWSDRPASALRVTRASFQASARRRGWRRGFDGLCETETIRRAGRFEECHRSVLRIRCLHGICAWRGYRTSDRPASRRICMSPICSYCIALIHCNHNGNSTNCATILPDRRWPQAAVSVSARQGSLAATGSQCSRFVLALRPTTRRTGRASAMRVIGIDPGLRYLGWGVIAVDGPRLTHLGNGIVTSGEGALAAAPAAAVRRADRGDRASSRPTRRRSSRPSSTRTAAATLKLGQARGIALLVPARAGLDGGGICAERGEEGGGRRRPCRTRRRSTTWCGCSFRASRLAGPDAADALAVAICHAHHAATRGRYAAALAAGAGMIGRIAGRLIHRGADHVVIDVARGRLCGAGLGPHARRAARARRGGGALDRTSGARGCADAGRLPDAVREGLAPRC